MQEISTIESNISTSLNNQNLTQSSSNQFNKKKVAILFFGLTRSLPNIYSNLEQNLFNQLTKHGYEYDTFIHTYVLSNPYINPWSGEHVNNYNNKAYQILKPKDYILQRQDLVEKRLKIPKYFAKLGTWAGCAKTPEMCAYLIRNMVLALHSKKQVTELFMKYKNNYNYVIFARPDQFLDTPFNPISFKLLKTNTIIIPKQHSYFGVNDRFCVAKPNEACIYGLAFHSLLPYSKNYSIVSEVFMKHYLEFSKLNIIYSSLQAHLVRA